MLRSLAAKAWRIAASRTSTAFVASAAPRLTVQRVSAAATFSRSFSTRLPVTVLSEDEQELKDMVQKFAVATIKPKVREMDANSKMDPAVLKGCFEQGLMGLEIPTEHGGSGMVPLGKVTL